jgi:hypothetical protein
MKKTIRLAALTIGFIAAVLTLGPIGAHAADSSVGTHLESIPQLQDRGCPIAHSANAAECGGSVSEHSFSAELAMRETDSEYHISSAQHSTSRSLLEDLLRNGPDRSDAESPLP